MATDAGADPDGITIVIKNVYEPGETFRVLVYPDNTVGELKSVISQRVVTGDGAPPPRVDEQTLVFGGRICKNDATIADVVRSVRSRGVTRVRQRQTATVCKARV